VLRVIEEKKDSGLHPPIFSFLLGNRLRRHLLA
jgi:hypothetical protein